MRLSFYPTGTFSGKPSVHGLMSDADYIVVHEFGLPYASAAGLVNEQLVTYILEQILSARPDLPVVAGKLITNEFERQAPKQVQFVDQIDTKASRLPVSSGTQGELLEEKRIRAEHPNLQMPIRVAQANHVGRATAQAACMQIPSIVLQDLPAGFDSKNPQLWVRNKFVWAVSQLVVVPLLRTLKQM